MVWWTRAVVVERTARSENWPRRSRWCRTAHTATSAGWESSGPGTATACSRACSCPFCNTEITANYRLPWKLMRGEGKHGRTQGIITVTNLHTQNQNSFSLGTFHLSRGTLVLKNSPWNEPNFWHARGFGHVQIVTVALLGQFVAFSTEWYVCDSTREI